MKRLQQRFILKNTLPPARKRVLVNTNNSDWKDLVRRSIRRAG